MTKDTARDGSTASFHPGPGAERQYRDALGRFGTGVAVVTTATPDGPCGITVNSFASVSLRPALVLWSIDRASDRFAAFNTARRSAIHVLSAHQAALAERFARSGDDFAGLDWRDDGEGVPLLPGCASRFDCALHASHDGGDHRILVNRVLRFTLENGPPLIFARGRFGRFATAD